MERLLASMWADLLDQRPFGVEDSFFDVGGDSLLVARLHDRVCVQTGLPIPLTDLFRFPTVRSLAKHLEEQHRPAVAAAVPQPANRGRLQRGALDQFRKR